MRKTISHKEPSFAEYVLEIWAHRSLIRTFAIRDIKAKYAQTVVGSFWTLLQPLTGLIIYWIFFDFILKIETDGIPYALFVFAGIIAWQHFSTLVHHGGNSLISNTELMHKMAFPRMVLPLSKVVFALIELFFPVLLLVGLMLFLADSISWKVVFAPGFILLVSLFGFSISLFISALSIRFRDTLHFVPYLINFGIWLTPVFYPVSLVPEKFVPYLYGLNPLIFSIEGLRWCLFNKPFPSALGFLSVGVTLIIFLSAILSFRKAEKNMIDLI